MTTQAPDWLNTNFMRKILKKSENDETIEVTNLTTEPVVGNGENYSSTMIRTNVEFSSGKSDLKKTMKKSLIIKIAPTVGGDTREILEKFEAFGTEINMMTTTLSKMKDILKDDDFRLSPRILYTETGDTPLLVMEDLAPLGFRMADRHAGLDLDHCLLVISRLAKFHASSVALCEKDPKVMATYNGGAYKADHPKVWKDYVAATIKNIANEVLEWSELGPRAQSYHEKLLKLSEVCYERAVRCFRPNNGEFNVINHGDCWLNNMLFRYDDNGKVIDHIFVDYQLSFWSSPAIDILLFFNTSTTENVELHHRDTLLIEYLFTLTRTIKRLGCKTIPPNMAELRKNLRKHELYGMLASCITLPVILFDNNEFNNFNDLIKLNRGYGNPIYKGLAYRKIIMRRLPEWDACGLMNV